MAFAFMCHHNTFLIYESIERATQQKWDIVTHWSLFTSFLIAAAFGIIGYATFTSYVQGDLMENYCWDDDLMNFARLMFSGTILLTFPIECFVTREVSYFTFFNISFLEKKIDNKLSFRIFVLIREIYIDISNI